MSKGEVIEMPGCAPPVIVTDHATGESQERKTDRAYTEAGMMPLKDYIEKWGSAL